MTLETCPLCDRALKAPPTRLDTSPIYRIECVTCGDYLLESRDIEARVFDTDDISPRRYLLSAMTKASNVPLLVDRKVRDNLKDGLPRDKTPEQKIELLLQWLGRSSTEIGWYVETEWKNDYPIAWCKSLHEWGILFAYVERMGLIEANELEEHDEGGSVRLTHEGWQWLHRQPKATGSKVFIAMAFDPELNDVKAAIQRAIEQAGYDPLRVDDDHYSGGVMDRIIMHIRDSKFIVADFTKNRGGVYYEAGVAFGLGIEVVNVCDDACLKDDASKDVRLHFDVRHLVFVPWKADQLAKFSDDLRNHIIAVHGRGPRSPGA